MEQFVVGVGGMTNGGKSTLAASLHQHIPNSYVIAQDSFFKEENLVSVDSRGFKQYDVLEALQMDKMMSAIEAWQKNPLTFLPPQDLQAQESSRLHVLIIEGFLIYNYGPLCEKIDKKFYLQIPYETCKKRRSSRVYVPPDPCGYFDGHVWPMYLKHRKEMEQTVPGIVYLDGSLPMQQLFEEVYNDIQMEMRKLLEKD